MKVTLQRSMLVKVGSFYHWPVGPVNGPYGSEFCWPLPPSALHPWNVGPLLSAFTFTSPSSVGLVVSPPLTCLLFLRIGNDLVSLVVFWQLVVSASWVLLLLACWL